MAKMARPSSSSSTRLRSLPPVKPRSRCATALLVSAPHSHGLLKREAEKLEQKAASLRLIEKKKEERLAKSKLAPEQMFRQNEHAGMFSQYDEKARHVFLCLRICRNRNTTCRDAGHPN